MAVLVAVDICFLVDNFDQNFVAVDMMEQKFVAFDMVVMELAFHMIEFAAVDLVVA